MLKEDCMQVLKMHLSTALASFKTGNLMGTYPIQNIRMFDLYIL